MATANHKLAAVIRTIGRYDHLRRMLNSVAAHKICTVLASEALQQNLRQHLSQQAANFSIENFQAGLHDSLFELPRGNEAASRTNLFQAG
jgi:hypothetical protein